MQMKRLVAVALAGWLASSARAAYSEETERPHELRPSIVTLAATSGFELLLQALREELGSSVELKTADSTDAPVPTRVGTGIVFAASGAAASAGAGYLVSSAAFVSAGGPFRALLADGKELAAQVVGLDLATDVAVLRIDARPRAARFAENQRALTPGTKLCIFGAQSANRCAATETQLIQAKLHPGAGRLHDFLLLAAEPGPGAAGAAVVDPSGSVVGMVTALRRGGGTVAVPAATVLAVAREITEAGAVRRGWLGLTVVSGPERAADGPGARTPGGIRVLGVVPGSPAERAGILPGDILASFQGYKLTDMAELARLVNQNRPGSEVEIQCRRDDKLWRTTATLTERPAPEHNHAVVLRLQDERAYLGLETGPAPSRPERQGVAVQTIADDSPARGLLQVGDVITALDGAPITDVDGFRRAILQHAPGEQIRIQVRGTAGERELSVALGKRRTEIVLPELPSFHLTLDSDEWRHLVEAVQALPAADRARSALAIQRFLERKSARLAERDRHQIEAFKAELEQALSAAQVQTLP